MLPDEVKYQIDAFVDATKSLMNNDKISAEQKAVILSDERFQEVVATAAAINKVLNGRDISELSNDELAQLSMEAGFRLEFADNGDGTSAFKAYYDGAVKKPVVQYWIQQPMAHGSCLSKRVMILRISY